MMVDADVKIGLHDVSQAAGLLCGAVAAVALVYGQFATMPGLVWPALVAIAAAGGELARRCWQKPAQVVMLAKLTPNFVRAAVGAVILALLMPALFPDGAYEREPWVLWTNATLLLGGLLAVPAARLITTLAARLAQRRIQQGPEKGTRN